MILIFATILWDGIKKAIIIQSATVFEYNKDYVSGFKLEIKRLDKISTVLNSQINITRQFDNFQVSV